MEARLQYASHQDPQHFTLTSLGQHSFSPLTNTKLSFFANQKQVPNRKDASKLRLKDLSPFSKTTRPRLKTKPPREPSFSTFVDSTIPQAVQKLQPYNRLELSVRQPALKSIMLQHDDLIAMRTHFNKTNTLQEKEKIGFLNKSSIRFSPEGFQSPNNSDVKTKTSRLFHVTGGRLG